MTAADAEKITGLKPVRNALAEMFPWEVRHIEPVEGHPVSMSRLVQQVGAVRLVETERGYNGWSRTDHQPGLVPPALAVVGFTLSKGLMLEPPDGRRLLMVENEMLVTPYRPGSLVWRGFGSATLFLSFPADLVVDVLGRHFHLAAQEPSFDPRLLSDHHPGFGLRHMAQRALEDVSSLPDATSSLVRDLLVRQYQDVMTSLLLLHVPHSLSGQLQRAGEGGQPLHLRRALDYLHANLEQPLTLEAIAAAAGCSPRQLQLAFRSHLATTPMAMAKRLRLEMAEARLRSGQYRNVTDAALALHFSNLGRFAAEFRALFGYSPHQVAPPAP
ncbi:helix-turn-helix transcriptional regulator [Ancylobacter sonchi]|uniref:helix-turn-helix transcriptional regulator n=1 Tax=Ancylobacter sonchi TaxID=1937790 RepID=UPI001BD4603E|nr:AraC family transcriptional regulator [Ancylobacter sonchi]MBS7532598.1 helix-turn-helix transcriptional regulator [Ancylobacter sonchi]